jgi:hypothetical protein
MNSSVVFIPPVPAPLVAEAPLPGGAGAGGCVSSGAALLSGAW